MKQDKDDLNYSTKNGTSLESLAQMLSGCSADDHTLAKRQQSSLTFGSLQGTFLNPIKKKLKLEAGLQDGYELETSLGNSQSSNATLVKQEEADPEPNCMLEGQQTRSSEQEHSEKPSSKQSQSKRCGSYQRVKPKTIWHQEEFARQLKEQTDKIEIAKSIAMKEKMAQRKAKKEKIAEDKRIRQQVQKEKAAERSRMYREDNKDKCAKASRDYYWENKEKLAEIHKIYYQNNKDKCVENSRNYYQNNKEKCGKRGRNYYQNNKEEAVERARNYYQANKQKILEFMGNYHQAKKKEKKVRQPQIVKPVQSNSVEPQQRRRSNRKHTPDKMGADIIRRPAKRSTSPKDFHKPACALSPALTPRLEEPQGYGILSKQEPIQEECRFKVRQRGQTFKVKQEECRFEVKQEEY